MAETIDQVFVTLKHWLVQFAPAQWQPLVSALLSAAGLILTFAALFALTTILERKGLGRIQNRYGPNRVGRFGLLQPVADGIKALTKEDVIPAVADQAVHFLAPLVLVAPVFLALAVLPVDATCGGGFGCGGAVLLRRQRRHGVVGVYGGVVEPEQVFVAGGDAGDCADDQL